MWRVKKVLEQFVTLEMFLCLRSYREIPSKGGVLFNIDLDEREGFCMPHLLVKRSNLLACFGIVALCVAFLIGPGFTTAAHAEDLDEDTIKQIQTYLTDLGYPVGPIDGAVGNNTNVAIKNFQRNNNMPVNGNVSMELLDALRKAKIDQDIELTKLSANEAYIRATQFENQGEIRKAVVYYNYVMNTYPDNDLAVRASERHAKLSGALAPKPVAKKPASGTPKTSTPRFTPDITTKRALAIGGGTIVLTTLIFFLSDGDDDSTSRSPAPATPAAFKPGVWAVNSDYSCNEMNVARMIWDMRSDNRYVCLNCGDHGTWAVTGTQITVSSYTGYMIKYSGTVATTGDNIDGTFVDNENESGCWEGTLQY
jgi:hypothetical protein